MAADESMQFWFERAQAGDAAAQAELWDRFFPKLMRLAKSHLQSRLRIGDEEDVVLSVFQSFFRAAEENRFPDVRGGDDLWRLLSRMTQRKAIDWLRHAQRQKRQALGESALGNHSEGDHALENIAGEDRSPLLEVVAIEEYRRLLALLTPELQQLAMQKLDGFTNKEIAERQNCSVATVERRLKLIRDVWSTREQDE